jgi:cellulose synthase operon protein C
MRFSHKLVASHRRVAHLRILAAPALLLLISCASAQPATVSLQSLLDTGKYADAEQAANAALSAQSQDVRARIALGEAYAATGRYKQAITEFERASATAKGAEHLRSELRRAELLEITGNDEAARSIYQSFVTYYTGQSPRSAEELTLIARALVHLEKFKDANDLYLDAIKADGSFIEAQIGAGELYTQKYLYRDAAEFFADALKINPQSAKAYLGIAGNKRIDGGEEMRAALNHALEINPNLVEALALRASMELDLEHFDKAAADLDQALKVNPNSLEAHSLRAAMFFRQNRPSDQDAEIKAVLAINPHWGELFETLSHSATNTRRYAEAVEFSKRAIELSPRLWAAHLSLGIGLQRLGKVEEGRAEIETSFKGDPFNPWAKNTLDLLDSMRDYRETKRGPYIIKAAEKDSLATAGYAADLLDEATKKLTAKYRFTPQTPILVEMFPNHADFEVRVLGLTGLGALGVCFGQVVALDSPSARKIGEFNWGSTLWHEYTHVITLQMTNNLIPRWFSEGLSVYEERHARPGWGDDWSLKNLKAYRDGRWLKISELDGGFLRPKSPDQVPLSYFQASQVCEFIADKYGFDAILEMLRRYRERERTPEILEKVLKLSQPDFDRAFDEYIKAKVGSYIAGIPAGTSGTERLDKMSKEEVLGRVAAHPQDFALQLRSAALLEAAGDETKALEHYKRSIELFPFYTGDGNGYEAMAAIYEKLGDKPAAASALDGLVKLDENNVTALRRLAQLRIDANDKAKALDALSQSFYIDPFDALSHTRAGNLALELNQNERAAHEYEVALAMNPPNVAEANYNLARAYLASGKVNEARRAVMRSLEAAPQYDKAQELLLKITSKP